MNNENVEEVVDSALNEVAERQQRFESYHAAIESFKQKITQATGINLWGLRRETKFTHSMSIKVQNGEKSYNSTIGFANLMLKQKTKLENIRSVVVNLASFNRGTWIAKHTSTGEGEENMKFCIFVRFQDGDYYWTYDPEEEKTYELRFLPPKEGKSNPDGMDYFIMIPTSELKKV